MARCARPVILADEGQEVVDHGGKLRLPDQMGTGIAVHARGLLRDVALRVEQHVVVPPGRQVVDQLDGRDLDDAVAGAGDPNPWSRYRTAPPASCRPIALHPTRA